MSAPEKPPLLLAIDTGGPRLQLALNGQKINDHHIENIAKGHAEILFGAIDTLFARHGVTYADLTRLAVTTGPGSFTGLRIGLAAARGLALALNCPLIGVPTLLAMSLSGPVGGPFRIYVDARRSEAYIQDFSAPGRSSASPKIMPVEEGASTSHNLTLVTPDCVDIAALATFARSADPAVYPPDPAYLRAADAKPQTKFQVARLGVSNP